jgi:anti-anti-sigma regulatory factor
MTFKIESLRSRQNTTFRLIGRLQSKNLKELKTQLQFGDSRVVLDIADVTLVDVLIVRFLNACQDQGVEVVNGSPFILEWMARERSANA